MICALRSVLNLFIAGPYFHKKLDFMGRMIYSFIVACSIAAHYRYVVEEGEGFEPSKDVESLTVYKTGAINRSANPP